MTPEMTVVMFKVLKYADECLKAEVEPDLEQARKVAGVGNLYFTQVMSEADRNGLISGLYIPDYCDSQKPVVFANHMAITLKGSEYLQDNSAMKKAASMMGTAAIAVIDAAVSLTAKAQMGF